MAKVNDSVFMCNVKSHLIQKDIEFIKNNLPGTEPGFRLQGVSATCVKIVPVQVQGHADDDNLTGKNLYIKFKTTERDQLKQFLEGLIQIFDEREWCRFESDGEFSFKLETLYDNLSIYVKKGPEKYNEWTASIDKLNQLLKYRDEPIGLRVLLYRMYDIISNKYIWTAHQIGLKL